MRGFNFPTQITLNDMGFYFLGLIELSANSRHSFISCWVVFIGYFIFVATTIITPLTMQQPIATAAKYPF